MNSPTFGSDGYPTEETLEAIRKWDYKKCKELFQFIYLAWRYPECLKTSEIKDDFGRDAIEIKMATAGWSGNEDIVRALKENLMVWNVGWQLSKRGGLTVLQFPKWMFE